MDAKADNAGNGFAAQAGYDPKGLIDFFDGLDLDGPSRWEKCFYAHPMLALVSPRANRFP